MELLEALQKSEGQRCEFHHFDVTNVKGPDTDDCVEIGGWFVALENSIFDRFENKSGPYVISIKHGRSAVYRYKGKWVSIKGVGWTIGAAPIVRSIKDERLIFGLLGKEEAGREVLVSNYFRKLKLDMPLVLGYASFNTEKLPEGLKNINNIKYSDGVLINPCLVYMECLSPIRVADLPYLSPAVKDSSIQEACGVRGWHIDNFIDNFIDTLGYNIGSYHAVGCVNDSMHFDNVTLSAEVVDYEWISVPGIPLPDGSSLEDDNFLPEDIRLRQEKELLYAIEVCMELGELIQSRMKFNDTSKLLFNGYDRARSMSISLISIQKYIQDWSLKLD